MAKRQYTDCVKPGNFLNLGFSYLGWMGFTAGSVTFVIAALSSGALAAIAPAIIAILAVLVTFLLWWLYGRLICLGSVECAIGAVYSRGNPQPLKKAGDDDATVNVLLAGGPAKFLKEIPKTEYWANPVQGHLIKENDSILAIGRSYVQDEGHMKYVKMLHCEFEGSGIRNLLIWASTILALAIAAVIIPPPFNLIIATIAWLITLMAGISGLGMPLNPGDPADINPNLGSLKAGDIVVIKGDWIYDSLHDGWNEFHAVHACQILLPAKQAGNDWPADIGDGLGLDTPERVKEAVDFWCHAIRKAEDAEEEGSRDDPANNWVIHPLIDGCKPPPIIL